MLQSEAPFGDTDSTRTDAIMEISHHRVATPVRVDVEIWDLDVTAQELKTLSKVLSADECARAARFVDPVHRNRWIAARGRLRQVLGRCSGREPASIALRAQPNGKPILEGEGRPHFNLSHSGAIGILAHSRDLAVGADIEMIRPISDEVIEYALSSVERDKMKGLGDEARQQRFFRSWVLKEAFVKCLGTGLSLPLDHFDLEPDLCQLRHFNGGNNELSFWYFDVNEIAPGAVAAVAVRAEGRPVNLVWHGP